MPSASLSCRGLDPFEDTESEDDQTTVKTTRIRYVAGVSIRLRILKDLPQDQATWPRQRCRGLDPFEDTESEDDQTTVKTTRIRYVAGVSIRLRILKDLPQDQATWPRQRCRGLDPFEDTES